MWETEKREQSWNQAVATHRLVSVPAPAASPLLFFARLTNAIKSLAAICPFATMTRQELEEQVGTQIEVRQLPSVPAGAARYSQIPR